MEPVSYRVSLVQPASPQSLIEQLEATARKYLPNVIGMLGGQREDGSTVIFIRILSGSWWVVKEDGSTDMVSPSKGPTSIRNIGPVTF